MSAFIVSKDHIDALVTADRVSDYPASQPPDHLGQMLWDENFRSVNARYGTSDAAPPYTFTPYPGAVDPVVVLKAVQCYEYQSCEHDEWPTSAAHAFCRSLEQKMICSLPGYDEAPWGIDDRSAFALTS